MCDIVKIRIRMGMGEEAKILWIKENGSWRREIVDVDLFFPNKFGREKRWVQKVSSSWRPRWHTGSVVLHNFSFKKDWNVFLKIGSVKILMRRNPEKRKIWIYRKEAEFSRGCGTGEGKRDEVGNKLFMGVTTWPSLPCSGLHLSS